MGGWKRDPRPGREVEDQEEDDPERGLFDSPPFWERSEQSGTSTPRALGVLYI